MRSMGHGELGYDVWINPAQGKIVRKFIREAILMCDMYSVTFDEFIDRVLKPIHKQIKDGKKGKTEGK